MQRRFVLALLVAMLGLVVAPVSPAWAHFGLAESTPADGAKVPGPLTEIRLVFTKPGTLVGEGFELFDGDGRAVPVTAETPDGGITWVVSPEGGVASGTVGLAWTAAAPDGHPRSGTVTVTVTPAAVASPSPTPAGGASAPAPPAAGSGDALADALTGATSTDEGPVRWAGIVGRWLSFAATLVAVGGLVFGATTVMGSHHDVAVVARWVQRCVPLLLVGVVMELVAHVMRFGDGTTGSVLAMSSLVEALDSSAGAAIVTRFAGGLVLLGAASLTAVAVRGRHTALAVVAPAPVAMAAGRVPGGVPSSTGSYGRDVSTRRGSVGGGAPVMRGRLSRPVMAALAGVLLLGSFLLDGHTVTAGPRLLVIVSDVAHTAAAAVWVGGVVMLAALLASRARRGAVSGVVETAARFSVPAAAAVALAGVAGVGLASTIVDSPGQLLSTQWGRVLLVKLALVAAVAAVGLYNNNRLVPALEEGSVAGPNPTRRLRRAVTVEAGLMVAVVLVTAILVVSAT